MIDKVLRNTLHWIKADLELADYQDWIILWIIFLFCTFTLLLIL